MPNLLDIRRRIRSVKNTQQITQALKMVSAAKLRRAQEQALAARPYAQQIAALMAGLAPYLDAQALGDVHLPEAEWPLGALLERRELKRRLLLVVTSDSGLAGAFNANVLKAIAALPAPDHGVETRIAAIGRKGRDAFKRRGAMLASEHIGLFARAIEFSAARTIAREAMNAYATGAVDEVTLVGNEFKSVLQQQVAVHRLLPFEVPEQAKAAAGSRDYIFETAPAELFAELLPRALEAQVFRALLESMASEHAARMNAMEAATSNAGDLIDSLTLNMNRVRQAAITKEIIEVVSGAAALG
ncbi:MAG TPA: ATP synthase F1 subunit gamma [Terriglobales bacterium]|nr:ATP synthase F1 subunit gamma [Terriglobales bacterium]